MRRRLYKGDHPVAAMSFTNLAYLRRNPRRARPNTRSQALPIAGRVGGK